jgi:hypothetical protein
MAIRDWLRWQVGFIDTSVEEELETGILVLWILPSIAHQVTPLCTCLLHPRCEEAHDSLMGGGFRLQHQLAGKPSHFGWSPPILTNLHVSLADLTKALLPLEET